MAGTLEGVASTHCYRSTYSSKLCYVTSSLRGRGWLNIGAGGRVWQEGNMATPPA